jgi:hypothetical protein
MHRARDGRDDMSNSRNNRFQKRKGTFIKSLCCPAPGASYSNFTLNTSLILTPFLVMILFFFKLTLKLKIEILQKKIAIILENEHGSSDDRT